MNWQKELEQFMLNVEGGLWHYNQYRDFISQILEKKQMYTLKLKHHFDAAHKLDLTFESPCCNLHGHRWNVEVEISSQVLNDECMIVDFAKIKNVINQLDHKYLNDILKDTNPTAETIAEYLHEKIDALTNSQATTKVTVYESPEASITYEN